MEYVYWLFDYEPFIPRTGCVTQGEMPAWIVASSVITDALTAVAYTTTAIIFLYIATTNKSPVVKAVKNTLIFFFFVFLFCGLTHVVDIFAFSRPMYRLDAVVKIMASIFSICMVPFFLYAAKFIERLPDVVSRLIRERNTARIIHGDK